MASFAQKLKNWFAPELNLNTKGSPDGSFQMGGIDSPQFVDWVRGFDQMFDSQTLTFPIVARDGFEQNVITYKCVMTIANGVADLRYQLFNKATGLQIQSHPILDLLKSPNPTQGQSGFLQHAIADLLLDGNMFIEKVRPSLNPNDMTTPPKRLWALQPDFVQIIVGPKRLPLAYCYWPGGVQTGESQTYPVDPFSGKSNILHIKSYAPLRELSEGRGLSPVRSAWKQILTHNEGARWNFALLKNQARPSGVLSAEGDLTEEQIEVLKKQMRSWYDGSRSAGKPLVLANGISWNEMSLSPVDMAYLEGKNSVARDICLALGVPPLLLHIPGDTTYNNVEQAKLSLYEETILPRARHLVDELNRSLVSDFDPNLELRVDEDCIPALMPRRAAKWKAVSQACGGTFMTIDEGRKQLGLEPLPDGAGAVVIIPSMANTLENLVENPPNAPQPGSSTTDSDDDSEVPDDPDEGNDTNT